jgi:hypothetical protein
MANPLDIVIRLFAKGGDDVARDFDNVADAGERMGDSLEKSVGRLEKIQAFEGIANAGARLADAGRSVQAFSDSMIQASADDRAITQRLESILKAQKRVQDMAKIETEVGRIAVEGHFDDDDSIKEAGVLLASFSVKTEHMGQMMEMAGRQSRTAGKSIQSVGEQLGKAYSTGNIAMLAKSGLTLGKQEIAAVKAAYGVSKLAGQMKFMEIVGKAVRGNTVSLNDSLTETEKRANDATRAWDGVVTAFGKGGAEAQATTQNIVGSIGKILDTSPGLVQAAGYWTHFGGQAATAGGSVLEVAGNIGSATVGMKSLGITSSLTFTTMKAGAASVAIAVAAIAATIYGAIKAYQGLQDATMGDEELVEKHGVWGEIWSKGGKFLGENKAIGYTPLGLAVGNNSYTGQNNQDYIGAPIKPPRAKNRQRKAPNGDTHVTFDPVVIKTPKTRGFS